MKKLNTTPISGMQELLPAAQARFNQLKREIEEVYRLNGYQNIETPTIDRTEILLAKAGGETEKQIYKVIKTAESADQADQALRFDHTVPLARYIVEHENDLTFPFKVSQIGRNYRGERAQKGRFREFYQCDIDVVGRGSLSIDYDADVIATLCQALRVFELPATRVRVSNRKILSGLLDKLGLADKATEIFAIVDHAEKVPAEKTAEALNEIGLTQAQADQLREFMAINGAREEAVAKLRALGAELEQGAGDKFSQGVDELEQVLLKLEKMQFGCDVVADMLIVRGLDYYTGTVFETFLIDHHEIGSICSGGRYENLAGHYTDQAFPGVGGSIGLTRLFYVLNATGLLNLKTQKPIAVAIVPISANEQTYSYWLAHELRQAGKTVDVVLADKRLGDRLTYAAKIADAAIVVGENEVANDQVMVKQLDSGELLSLDEYLQLD